jgi:3'-phosphoadenosine 5'-phosphosulfate sulfotransferase (PAPS reductase)/FAD synthetase
MLKDQPAFAFAAQDFINLHDKRVMIGLSGGINSMAALCYLGAHYQEDWKPEEIWLYYVHLEEHSPDTLDFVKAGIAWAEKHFKTVHSHIEYAGSVLDFFEGEKFVPHPIISPCSDRLKFRPMEAYAKENGIDFDLIGFIRTERQRITRQQKRKVEGKIYPISHFSDEECFRLVDQEIDWHPAIYDIRNGGGAAGIQAQQLPAL